MIKNRINILYILAMFCYSTFCEAKMNAVAIVQKFLSPGGSLAMLIQADPSSGKPVKAEPAVLECQLGSGKKDIVFAENLNINSGQDHILSISVLVLDGDQYKRIFTKTYYDKVLFAENFRTVGLQSVSLTTDRTGLLIITSEGAFLSGDPELLIWKDGIGFVNVLPPQVGGGYQFGQRERDGRLELSIGYSKGKFQPDAPHPVTLD